MNYTVKPVLYSKMVPSLTDEDLRKIGGGSVKINARVEFAPEEIMKLEKRSRRKVLGRIGAYVRQVVRNSLKYRKNPDKSSAPGRPPFWHGIGGAGMTLKSSIVFEADEFSTVIGPAVYQWDDIGGIHEFGGRHSVRSQDRARMERKYKVGDVGPVSTERYRSFASPLRRQGITDPRDGSRVAFVEITSKSMADHARRLNKRIAKSQRRFAIANYPARPFVGPAFNRSKPHLAEFWRGAITT